MATPNNLEKAVTNVSDFWADKSCPLLTALQDEWTRLLQRAWKLSPAMAVHMAERFKQLPVQTELSRLVRADPKAVIDVAEALHFLLGDRLDTESRSLLKVSPPWSTILPVCSQL
jgi:phosphatidylinositol 4-kinase